MLVTVMPDRLKGACDPMAWDRWQDQEGVVDASDACRAAWQAWRGEWQRVRAADLRAPLGRVRDWRDDLAEDQLVAVEALLRCRGRRGSTSRRERTRFNRWLSRAERNSPLPLGRVWAALEGGAVTRREAGIVCLMLEMWQDGYR